MKNILLTFMILLPALLNGQVNRKAEIEKQTEKIYTVKELLAIADSLQMIIDELCDYPIISPIKQPQRISSYFGWRRHPIYKISKFHTGIDIPEAKGTLVYATGNGIVIRKGYNSGYGNYIEIKHSDGFRSFYAHLSKSFVKVGDSILIMQPIGCVGNTGVSRGNHLHYEVRKGNRHLNPWEWCNLLYKLFVP